MTSHLIQPFTFQEVLFATKSLGKDVCPGKDRIGIGFYLHYWDFLGPILTRATKLIFSTGTMPAEWKEGIIYIIPKSNVQCDEVSKWRPITLLNDIYKIVVQKQLPLDYDLCCHLLFMICSLVLYKTEAFLIISFCSGKWLHQLNKINNKLQFYYWTLKKPMTK